MLPAIAQCRSSLDLTAGPLLAGTLINMAGGEKRLFLTIHHVVVDLVSWRIILQDLETLLKSSRDGIMASLPPPPLSFPGWCNLQDAYAEKTLAADPINLHELPAPMLSYWGFDDPTDKRLQDTLTQSFTLSTEATSVLFGRCSDAFRT